MKKPARRADVVALYGEFKNSVVSQQQLKDLADAQAAAWSAHSWAAKLAQRIRLEIDQGATVEAGEFYFDKKMEMAAQAKT